MNSNHRVRGRSRELHPSGHRFRGPSTSPLSGMTQLSCTVTGASSLLLSLHSLLATAFKDEALLGCDRYASVLRVLCGEENDPSARPVLGCRLLTHRPGGFRALNSLTTAERVAPVQGLYRTGIACRYSVACAGMRVGDGDASGRHPVVLV